MMASLPDLVALQLGLPRRPSFGACTLSLSGTAALLRSLHGTLCVLILQPVSPVDVPEYLI